MERETGIEPATNSLEGCDSTTELLPPSRRLTSLPAASASALSRFGGTSRRGRPAHLPHSSDPSLFPTSARPTSPPSSAARAKRACRQTDSATNRTALSSQGLRGWWGGEGSNLRSPKAAGLQPAAIDRSATSPKTHLSEAFTIRQRARCPRGRDP